MAGNIIRKHFNADYEPVGVFTSATAYVAKLNKKTDFANNPTDYEGLTYYDKTLNQLRTFDGSSWSPAGMSGTSTGGLNNAASIGQKITLDGTTVATGIEIECTDDLMTAGPLLLLDNDEDTDSFTVFQITNAGDGISIDIDGQASSDDIQGTGDNWAIDSAGVGTFTSLVLADDELISFGNTAAAPDMTLGWDATQLEFIPSTSNYAVVFGDADPYCDVKMWGKSTNAIVLFDASGEKLIFDGYDVQLKDDDILEFGDDKDVSITWDDSNLLIEPLTQDTGQVRIGSNNAMDLAIYDSGATKIALFDADTAILELDGWDINLQDDDYLLFGDVNDVTFQWDGTNFEMFALAADTPFDIGGTTTGFDITYYFKTAGTVVFDYDGPADGNTAGIILDGGADTLAMHIMDGDYLMFGDSATHGGTSDATMRWEAAASNLEIIGNVLFEDNVQIGESGSTNTLIVYGDTTLNGSLTYTGSIDAGTSFAFEDNESLAFGDDDDITFVWNGTNFLIEIETDDAGKMLIGATNAMDLVWYDSDATDTFALDAAASTCTLLNLGLVLTDGTSPFTFAKPVSNAINFDAGTADETVNIGAGTNTDWIFHGGTATYDVHWDANVNTLGFLDDALIGFGNTAADPDIQIYWDRTELAIDGKAGNEVINIGKTTTVDVLFNGGNAGRDVLWDASDNSLEFLDLAILSLGTGGDLETSVSTATITTTLAAGSDWKIVDTDNAASKITFGLTTGASGLDIQFNTITAGEDIIFDAGAKTLTLDNVDIILSDDDLIQFGDATDMSIEWVGSSSVLDIDGAVANRNIRYGYGTNVDVTIYANTTNANIKFDTDDSAKLVTFEDFDLILKDDDILEFGDTAGGDASIQWVGGSSALQFEFATADHAIWFGKSTNVDIVIFGDTSTDAVTFDTSAEDVQFNGFDLTIMHDDIINFGDADELSMSWVTARTALCIEGSASNKVIHFGYTNNVDLIIHAETTGAEITFDTDNSAKLVTFDDFDLQLNDADVLNLGDSADITISWAGGTNTYLSIDSQAVDNIINIGKTNNVDVVFFGDTSTDAVTFDTSAEDVQFNGFDLTILDDDFINFGDADDVTISWVGSSSELQVEMVAADKAIVFGKSTNFDFIVYGDTSTDAVTFDTSAEVCTFDGFDLHLNDSDVLEFGDTAAGDITMTYVAAASNFVIDGATADRIIAVGKTNNLDLVVYGDTTTDSVTFDTSAEMLTFDGFDITINDDDIIKFGDAGADGTIASDGTNIDFTITAKITFGDGGSANYTQINSTGDIKQVGTAKLQSFKYNVGATGTNEAYAVSAASSGVILTTGGATAAFTFTLPTLAAGLNYEFWAVADQNMIVASNEGDNMALLHDIAGDSVAYQTGSELIGGGFGVVCDGTTWFVKTYNWSDDALDQTITTVTA